MPPYKIIDDTCIQVSRCQTTTGYIVNGHYIKTLLQNVKITDVGLVLKLLIYILIEFKIIQTDKIDNKTIFKIIDSSLNLLETSLKVSNIKFNCSCCPWFRK